MADPIDLTLERLSRLEKKIDALHHDLAQFRADASKRFEGVESALGKMVGVLEAHDQRLDQIVSRLDV